MPILLPATAFVPCRQVRFGFAGKRLWHLLDQRRAGPAVRGVAPVWLGLVADIKFFGLHKGGWIRDAILSVTDASAYEQGR
jgi:hypothetical protein